jgi:hypothetical protein
MEFKEYILEFLEFISEYFTEVQINELKENFEENFSVYGQKYFAEYLYPEHSDKSFEDVDNNEFEKTGFYKTKDGMYVVEQQIF